MEKICKLLDIKCNSQPVSDDGEKYIKTRKMCGDRVNTKCLKKMLHIDAYD